MTYSRQLPERGGVHHNGITHKHSTAEHEFDSRYWFIKNDDRKNLAQQDRAYDKMIINQYMANEYVAYDIFTDNIDKSVSDHYPVQPTLNPDKEQVITLQNPVKTPGRRPV